MLDIIHYTMPICMYTHMYVCIRNEYNLMLVDFATIPLIMLVGTSTSWRGGGMEPYL